MAAGADPDDGLREAWFPSSDDAVKYRPGSAGFVVRGTFEGRGGSSASTLTGDALFGVGGYGDRPMGASDAAGDDDGGISLEETER